LFLVWPLSVNFTQRVDWIRALLRTPDMLQMAAEQILTSTGFAVAAGDTGNQFVRDDAASFGNLT
jgi:hypothetical protein